MVLTVTALNGFNSAVGFTSAACSGLPAESACSFGATSVMGSGTTQVTITTTSPHPSAVKGATFAQRFNRIWIGFGILLPGIFAMVRSARKYNGTLFLILFVAALTMSSCGGGSSGGGGGSTTDPGTPVGNYPVTITATSGSLTHTATFQLVVQ